MKTFSYSISIFILCFFTTLIVSAQNSNNKNESKYTNHTVDYAFMKGLDHYRAKNYLLAAQYLRIAKVINQFDYDAYYLLSNISKKYNYSEESCYYLKIAMNSKDSMLRNNYKQFCDSSITLSYKLIKDEKSIFHIDSAPTIKNVRGYNIEIDEFLKTKIDRFIVELQDYYVPSLKENKPYNLFNIYIIISENGKVEDLFIMKDGKLCNYRLELLDKFNEKLVSVPAKKNGFASPITYTTFMMGDYTKEIIKYNSR